MELFTPSALPPEPSHGVTSEQHPVARFNSVTLWLFSLLFHSDAKPALTDAVLTALQTQSIQHQNIYISIQYIMNMFSIFNEYI